MCMCVCVKSWLCACDLRKYFSGLHCSKNILICFLEVNQVRMQLYVQEVCLWKNDRGRLANGHVAGIKALLNWSHGPRLMTSWNY